MKKLILIRGESSSGKSTVILNTCVQYLNNSEELFRLHGGNDAHVYVGKHEKKMCFASAADQLGIIRGNVGFFLRYECDIGISALNTSSGKDGTHWRWWEKALREHGLENVKIDKKLIIKVKKNEEEQKRVIKELKDKIDEFYESRT